VLEAEIAPSGRGGAERPDREPYDATFYEHYGINPFVDTEEDHLSTFAIDVDTASYTVARRYIDDGNLPPKDAVRIEEFINYFKYYYEPPEKGAFAIYTEAAPSQFGAENHKMLKIGLKGKEIKAKDRKNAVLTFVIDVSGSMARGNRLGLVKQALRLLLNKMREGDRVGIVVYGTNARVITKPLDIEYRDALIDAINKLRSEGSTNAEEGLLFGYKMANKFFRKGHINRVILCSDGVANNGITSAEGILKKVREYAGQDIYLSTVGFGMGNYNDVLMEKLADKGNGNYAYVDSLDEAKRIFAENLTGMLQVIAKDVKIQVDFNPKVVRSYRLLGYENRDVADNKFRDDTVDGGEVGAGHSVTALYEVKLHDKAKGRVAKVHIRYKDPDSGSVTEVAREISAKDIKKSFKEASENFRLAAAAAEFAEILRQSYWAKGSKLRDVFDLAMKLAPEFDNRKDVIEFVNLVGKAGQIKGEVTGQEIEDVPAAAPGGTGDQSRAPGAGGGFLGLKEPRLSQVLPLVLTLFCMTLGRVAYLHLFRPRSLKRKRENMTEL
jgi:Ca-activated chloride channel family protein